MARTRSNFAIGTFVEKRLKVTLAASEVVVRR